MAALQTWPESGFPSCKTNSTTLSNIETVKVESRISQSLASQNQSSFPVPFISILLTLFLSVSARPGELVPQPVLETMSKSGSQSPPTPPPIVHREISASAQTQPSQRKSIPTGLTLYSIGDPTDEEQLYLEYINRARANPTAEGLGLQSTTDADVLADYEFFGVNIPLMLSQFAAISPAPPVSLNSRLTAAARLHSQDMLENQFQGHNGSNGSDLASRITAQNYNWTTIGENVFSYAHSVWHGHAGFNVDWGGNASTGGMQDPPGHRVSIHNPSFREVGIGVVNGSNGKVGPQLVTQDFASRGNPTPFVTGVAYYDLNGNDFYDVGEGIGDVTVLASGAQSYGLTASSGGYSVPVPGNGAYTVTFRVPGVPEVKRTVVVSNNSNVKVDLRPAYEPPVLSGPDRPSVTRDNVYSFTAVGGAKGYQWKRSKRVAFTEIEGAEAGLAKITAVTSPEYDVITSSVKASGNNSFHLAHPQKEDQILAFNPALKPGLASQLRFSSRLGWATDEQIARAQVSVTGGSSWEDLWSQPGSGGRGETAFTEQAIPLSRFAGQEILLRFLYDFTDGNYFPQTDTGVGLYIDNITVTDAEELVDEVITDIAGASVVFNPAELGDYSLRVRARVSEKFLEWGPAKLVSAQTGGAPATSLKITGIQSLGAGRLQIEFDGLNSLLAIYELESAPTVAGPWVSDGSASIQLLGLGLRLSAVTDAGTASQRFYRVLAR
jgi:hypothetical protein